MSHISIADWITALLIVLPLFGLIISIPSFVAMYKLSFKAYRQQIRILKIMSRKVSNGYKVTQNQAYTYSGTGYNGPNTLNKVEINHFFPIVIDKDHLIILTKKEGPFNILYMQYSEYKNKEWSNDNIEIKTSTCLLTQLLNDRFQKKIDSLMKESVQIDGVENLNDLLNSEITSIRREDKLKALLND
jgi:hypothetical protein